MRSVITGLACCALLLVQSCAPEEPGQPSATARRPIGVSGVAGSAAPPIGTPAGAQSRAIAGTFASTPLAPQPSAAGVPAAPPPAQPAQPARAGASAPVTPAPPTPPPATPAATGGTTPAVMVMPNQKLPPVSDYAAAGPFKPGKEVANTGPGGAYTMFRPSNLDANGFKFIPATWGNGITTTPQYYPWLSTVASHGFVIIAANSSTVTPDDMTKGLDWLLMQNDAAGELQGKLDTTRAVCIGYSLGGGGAVTCGAHPKVVATIAMHPAGGAPQRLHGPLLLFSGTADTVCVPDSFVQPVFGGSPVPTFYGLLDGADHLEPVLGGRETAPFIAWLRLWVFGDQDAKAFFYGEDCKLCKAPWIKPQRKMLP